MDAFPAGSTSLWRLQESSASNNHGPVGYPAKRMSFYKSSRRIKTICCSTFPPEAAVFTASRVNASTLRIIGPGSNFNTGLGCLLSVDEFFVQPFHQQEEPLGPHQVESLTYFLEVNRQNDTRNMVESQIAKHGIQVLFRTCKKDVADQYAKNKSLKLCLPITHVKDARSVQTLFLDSGKDKGGAKVRVVAGQYKSVSTTVGKNFVFLDTVMRPGSMAEIPVRASCGLLIYILEGVGIINRHPYSHPFYENEGHGIWFPPQIDGEVLGSSLHVTCHMWSGLRFLVLEVPVH